MHPVHHRPGPIRVLRISPGRPRVRPAHALGDKGYSSKAIRTWLRRRGSHGGRPPAFDKQLYKRRNVVERCFNRRHPRIAP